MKRSHNMGYHSSRLSFYPIHEKRHRLTSCYDRSKLFGNERFKPRHGRPQSPNSYCIRIDLIRQSCQKSGRCCGKESSIRLCSSLCQSVARCLRSSCGHRVCCYSSAHLHTCQYYEYPRGRVTLGTEISNECCVVTGIGSRDYTTRSKRI